MGFAPFENRLCRDIRNCLAKSFLETLGENRMDPVHQMALALKEKTLAPWHIDYIDNRLARYQIVLTQLKSDPEIFTTACLIWNQSLFFECHEWMESFWIRAKGNEKKLIQALIRAAGTYALLEAKRTSGAKKSAEKALAFLRVNRSAIPPFFKPDLLISALNNLESPPHKFMPTR